MRDPMSWALPVFRAFGIPVKVHLLFFVITLGFALRTMKDYPEIWWVDIFGFTMAGLFVVILIHEFGHCFGARWVGGDAKEVLIWPLGGLAFCEVPNTPRANFITTAAGPAMNIVICLVCAGLMAIAGFLPNANPFSDAYTSRVHNFSNGRTYTSPYGVEVYRAGTENDKVPYEEWRNVYNASPGVKPTDTKSFDEALARMNLERALLPVWAVWLNRIFWLSWFLFLFNLLPAYPLDGGRMLQAVVWARSSYRQGTTVAAYSGFAVSVVFLILSIVYNESLLMGLAIFMFYSAYMALHALDIDENPFGYDFSAGYTSLEKDDDPPPRKKRKPGPISRWFQARKTRKLKQEHAARQQDEERMDQLLDKIARTGKDSLTDEEKRFLERASTRYRNRS